MWILRSVIVLLFLSAVPIANADGPYYVDNAASGSNNGSSWTNAWQSIASINWATVAAGNNRTVYISGGISNKTYAQQKMDITAGGTSGNPIIILPGQESPHNGTVIIDGEDNASTQFYLIRFNGVEYVTLDGRVGTDTTPKIRLTRGYIYGIGVTGASRYLDIGYVEVDYCGYGYGAGTGIKIEQGVTRQTSIADIHHCKLHHSHDDDFQKGLHSAYPNQVANMYGMVALHHNEFTYGNENSITLSSGGVDVYNNTIAGPSYQYTAGNHYNGIQSNDGYLRIYNNTFSGMPTGSWGDAYIRLNPDISTSPYYSYAHYRIFNNVMIGSGTVNTYVPGLVVSLSDTNCLGFTDAIISNNTILDMNLHGLQVIDRSGYTADTVNTVSVVNNIVSNNGVFYSSGGSAAYLKYESMTWGSYGDEVMGVFDYNIIYQGADGWSTMCFINSGSTCNSLEYSTFKTTSSTQDHDAGSPIDPLLDASYIPTVSSPAVSAGVNLTSYCSETPALCYDKAGNARPAEGAWTIGAYEYNPSVTTSSGTVITGGSIR